MIGEYHVHIIIAGEGEAVEHGVPVYGVVFSQVRIGWIGVLHSSKEIIQFQFGFLDHAFSSHVLMNFFSMYEYMSPHDVAQGQVKGLQGFLILFSPRGGGPPDRRMEKPWKGLAGIREII